MLKNYYKNFIFLFIIILLFFLNSPFAFALEINNYPPIPGIGTPQNCAPKECLGQYVAYWFGVGIYIAGILAVIFLTIGGIRLMTSGGNPSIHREAIDIIKGAVLGLVLLIVAFLILTTINPEFAKPALTPLPNVEGIFYTNGTDRQPAPTAEPNTSNAPKGYNQIIYDCSSGPALFIWKFPKTNFEGIESAYTIALECGNSAVITDAGSFKLSFETAGIYYCLGSCSTNGTVCSGYMSDVNLSSGQLPEPFKDNVRSVLYVNSPASGIQYGAIFHSADDPTSSSTCSHSFNLENADAKRVCYNQNSDPSSSITVFAWNKKTPETSGNGVVFYSEPWGQSVGARAGKYFFIKDHIKNYFAAASSSLTFDYSGVNRPSGYKQLYQNFEQRPGSMYLQGNYLVAVHSGNSFPTQCQIFFKNVFNLNESEFIGKGNKINGVIVIPVR